MENASERMHSNKNSLSISGEESDGLTFGFPPTHTEVCVIQTDIYNLNFIVLLLISSRISQNWFPTASGVLLLVSRIIYLSKCNRLDIIIFRLKIIL